MVEKEGLEAITTIVLLLVFVAIVLFVILGTGMTTSAFGTIKWITEIIILVTGVLCVAGKIFCKAIILLIIGV